jgi:two-component system chemotaxis response regulator CheY
MKKALVVDDATTMRMYYRRILADLGFAADECVNGVAAIEKSLQTRYDLFVVDVNMPKMDDRFLEELRSRRDLHQALAIMVSIESEPKGRRAAYVAGANVYLTKPRHTGALLRAAALLTGEVQ